MSCLGSICIQSHLRNGVCGAVDRIVLSRSAHVSIALLQIKLVASWHLETSDEVGYILDEASQSFQLHSHKLAIALRVAPQLFREGRDEFHSLNSNLNVPQVPDAILARLSNATRAIVLISPDFYSAWNTRRELVGRSYLTLNEELKFCTLVLLFHPKSIDTWAYR